jgi:hypothetical protein
MTVGDSSQWNDFFADDLVPSVFDLVLKTWDKLDRPAIDEHEDATTVRLFSAMVRAKDRSVYSFLIRYQDVEVDFDLDKETGRKDIVFFPPFNDEEIYFCLEAKRLNVVKDGHRRALADEYVKEGMQRFIDRKYSKKVCHGGMLGYVLDGDLNRAMKNVARNISGNYLSLRMQAPGEWADSSMLPSNRNAKESRHQRIQQTAPILLHHLFVGAGQNGTVIDATTVNQDHDEDIYDRS